MFDLDKWQEIFNTIRKHKLRTFLTGLGVFWGIFMLVFLMGAGKGLENGVMGMLGGHAKNSLYVWTQRTAKAYKGLPPGRQVQLTMDDMNAIDAKFGDKIAYLAPRMWMPSGEVIHGDKKAAFDVRGDAPDLLQIDAIRMVKGRFINHLDIKGRRKIAIIGKRVRDVLFEGEEEQAIGQMVKIQGVEYKVVGTFESDRKGNDGEEDENSILLPITTVQQVRNRPNDIGWFVCAMYPDVTVSSIEEDLKLLLKERHNIAPDDMMGVRSDNVEEEFREINGLFIGIKFIVWVVGIGSLIAGVIGVGNIMLIVVKERTKEIGIRKAMGATPRSIINMILLESVFITSLAGYLGLLASTSIIVLMNLGIGEGSKFFANPEVDINVGIVAVIVLIFAGAFAGLIPAMHAANINPVVALKDE